MLFLFYFLLRDGGRMIHRLMNLVPLAVEQRARLLTVIANTTRAVVYGTGLTAMVQGFLVGVAFAIAGLASPVVFGVLAAVLALLPAGGAALVWMPASLWLAFSGSWGWALFMVLWGIGVTLADNVLRPLLIARHAPVSTPAVFVGVIGGVTAFGPVGIVAGPVLLTFIVALLRFAEQQMTHTA
jgi:predicted PurR-regulated permease PerM